MNIFKRTLSATCLLVAIFILITMFMSFRKDHGANYKSFYASGLMVLGFGVYSIKLWVEAGSHK